MITMKYNGGLGNQMFQYAAAISLAKKLGCAACFDMSFFARKYSRPYEMEIFGADKVVSKDKRIGLYWALRRYSKCKKFLGLNIYNETAFVYEKKFEQIEDNTFIEGFFQSPKYFDEELVREKFQFKNPPEGKNIDLIEQMRGSNSISIHIRRGDYVQKARYKNLFNQLDLEYYKSAVELISKEIENPNYFVFSDDPKWVQENLKIEGATYISHNTGTKSCEDLRLMTSCRHNIIANSSFSFWGAFLNPNPSKVVIAPKIWFSQNLENQKTTDIYPKEWKLI